jgi:hypothetical protein
MLDNSTIDMELREMKNGVDRMYIDTQKLKDMMEQAILSSDTHRPPP